MNYSEVIVKVITQTSFCPRTLSDVRLKNNKDNNNIYFTEIDDPKYPKWSIALAIRS